MALNLNPKPTLLLLLIRDRKRTLPAANAFPSGKRMVVQAKLRGAPRLEVRGRRHDVGFLTYCFSIITHLIESHAGFARVIFARSPYP